MKFYIKKMTSYLKVNYQGLHSNCFYIIIGFKSYGMEFVHSMKTQSSFLHCLQFLNEIFIMGKDQQKSSTFCLQLEILDSSVLYSGTLITWYAGILLRCSFFLFWTDLELLKQWVSKIWLLPATLEGSVTNSHHVMKQSLLENW